MATEASQKQLVSKKAVRQFIRRSVVETVQEILADPEYGLPLQRRAALRLQKYSGKNPRHPKWRSLCELRKG